ncbi:conserved hypothetical protein [Vibrio chagasii]|nr:conserved hypothetical protein [Vibrio chagasii]
MNNSILLPPYFSGVGSQKTPQEVGVLMKYVTLFLLQELGYCLRSGGARGADQFFESGVPYSLRGHQQIYMPEKNFQKGTCERIYIGDMRRKMDAMSVVSEYKLHEHWDVLLNSPSNNRTVANHLRNVFQVLGDEPVNNPIPSKMLIAWTPDGAKTWEKTSKATGGTRTAIRLALAFDVPVFNLAVTDDVIRIHDKVSHLYSVRGAPNINKIIERCAVS